MLISSPYYTIVDNFADCWNRHLGVVCHHGQSTALGAQGDCTESLRFVKWALYSSTIEASIITKNIPRVPYFTYTLKEPKTLFYFLRPLPSSTLIDTF